MEFTRISGRAHSRVLCTAKDLEEQVKDDVEMMAGALSLQEQGQVALVPAVMSHLAWRFADKALALGTRDKVDALKKLTRAVKALHKAYDDTAGKDLDFKHRGILERETERFLETCRHDFTILYYAVNSQFKKLYPDYPYDEMRTYAILSMLMIGMEERHNKRMDRMLAEKLGADIKPAEIHPLIGKLNAAMYAYAGIDDRGRFNETQTALAVQVIENRIKEIKFELT